MTYKKTDRVYGKMYGIILSEAQKGPFCVTVLADKLGQEVANRNCWNLVRAGKLVCVRAAGIGRNRPRAVYRLATT